MKKWPVLFLFLLSTGLFAQDSKFTALLILNFAKYVDWPAGEMTGDFVITVVGADDPVTKDLMGLAEKTKTGTGKIIVKTAASAGKVEKSHIVYISPDLSSTLPALLEKWDSKPLLIVTSKKGLGKEGATINLTHVNNQLKFEINGEALKKNGLTPRPVLFKLGTLI